MLEGQAVRITKIYNNNAVESRDAKGNEVIVVGAGVGFHMKTGEEIDETKIQKVFGLLEPAVEEKFKEFISYIPSEYLSMGNEIIDYVQEKLSIEQNTLLYLSLVDHIYAAVKRFRDGIQVKNVMLWDIRRFYKAEYDAGLYALKVVEKYTGIQLWEDEAGFLAFHMAEARMNENAGDMQKIMDIMSELSSIVTYHFKIKFNQDSVYYYRFVTHLKFFAQRLVNGKLYEEDGQNQLLDLIKVQYANSFQCVKKIAELVRNKYQYTLSSDELLYLTIHIERIIYKSGS